MQRILIFHLLFLLLSGLFGVPVAYNSPRFAIVYWLAWTLYGWTIYRAFRGGRVALHLSMIVPGAAFLLTAPTVAYNFFLWATGHPLYQDSPATIIIVAILAILITIPSALALHAYWKFRGAHTVPHQDRDSSTQKS